MVGLLPRNLCYSCWYGTRYLEKSYGDEWYSLTYSFPVCVEENHVINWLFWEKKICIITCTINKKKNIASMLITRWNLLGYHDQWSLYLWLSLIITISDTSKKHPKRLNSDNQINLRVSFDSFEMGCLLQRFNFEVLGFRVQGSGFRVSLCETFISGGLFTLFHCFIPRPRILVIITSENLWKSFLCAHTLSIELSLPLANVSFKDFVFLHY
jgi:hypothetical protein